MNREEKIKNLISVFNGTLPPAALKINRLVYFHQITDEQRAQVEAIVGSVIGNEKLLGLFDGVPIGLTLFFQRGLVEHYDVPVKFIDCNNQIKFNQFLETLNHG
ncbi:hypothetical protein ACVWYG_000723 [Pedobacter sp. UYEF25]